MANPGWYNDETDPALARWYDGVGWTEHVVVKADWEAVGHEPPPPVDVWEPPGWVDGAAVARDGRLRVAIGSAVVLAVLVVAGVALAQDGGDHPSNQHPSARQSDVSGAVGDEGGAVTGDDGDVTSIVPAIDGAEGTGDSAGSTNANGTTRTTSRTTPTTRSSSAVQRTETITQSHTDPGPVTQIGSGDKTSVGHTTDTAIRDEYVPPPPTTATTAEPTTTSSPDTTSTVQP